SVDCRGSNHEPNTVMQTAMPDAEPRTNPLARQYPAIASVVSRYHGPNHPGMPASVAFMVSRTHLAFGGWLGRQYDPFPGHLTGRASATAGICGASRRCWLGGWSRRAWPS